MNYDNRRITLVASGTNAVERDWQHSLNTPSRIIRVDSLALLQHAVAGGIDQLEADVERLILEDCGSASDYLSLLASLPQEFAGDVIMICDDGKAFLSATGRGGDRVLYSLTQEDLDFYFEAHQLVKSALFAESSESFITVPSHVWMRAAA